MPLQDSLMLVYISRILQIQQFQSLGFDAEETAAYFTAIAAAWMKRGSLYRARDRAGEILFEDCDAGDGEVGTF